jgi:L-threonylcarbamoyladenylate synthase
VKKTAYITKIIKALPESLDLITLSEAAELLRCGEIVAIPTETVYGLAANTFDPEAVGKIFAAKGRPQDNPLIVHISAFEELAPLVEFVPASAERLAEKFWPGPLTIILKKSRLIPGAVSAGLDTVAVRFPPHRTASELIRLCGFPLAAPSANISGRPSPTSALHVLEDLNGKIPLIVDGGPCAVGLESTIVNLAEGCPRLLRPGRITAEELRPILGNLETDRAVLSEISEGETVSSPGMKYKHYSPKAGVKIFDGSQEAYVSYMNSFKGPKNFAFCSDEDAKLLTTPFISYGPFFDGEEQARRLFFALREFDRLGAELVIAHAPPKNGVGLSVYNRLLRSAGFEFVR